MMITSRRAKSNLRNGEPPLGSEYGTASALDGDGTRGAGLGWVRNESGFLRATPFLWTEGERTAGDYSVVWNGTTADGRRVASGTYFIRLITPRETATHKIQVLR